MKNMQYLLSHIKSTPCFKKFKNNIYLDMIKESLPKVMKKYLYYMYVKNNYLIFIFEHPGLQIEFNHKKDFIKSCIKKVEEIHSVSLGILEVEGRFSTKLFNRKQKRTQNNDEICVYREKSVGDFTNSLKNKDLHLMLESIRNNIKKKR